MYMCVIDCVYVCVCVLRSNQLYEEQPLLASRSHCSLPESREGCYLPWLFLYLPGHSAPGSVQTAPCHLQLSPHLFQLPSQVSLSLPQLQVLPAGLLLGAAEVEELSLQL